MLQAFYTVSAGMQAQQKNIDIISNNIANLNTPGYRIRRVEFQELLDIQQQDGQAVRTGFGTKIASVSEMPLPDDVNPLGMEITGEGFFVLENADGERVYTQNGDFVLQEDGGTYYLASKTGEFVLDMNGNRIQMEQSDVHRAILSQGTLYPQGNNGEVGFVIGLVEFDNPEGLSQVRQGQFMENARSGQAARAVSSSVASNYFDELAPLAMANQISEITRVVQTQTAYQLSSKTLQVADEMEGMANHLRY